MEGRRKKIKDKIHQKLNRVSVIANSAPDFAPGGMKQSINLEKLKVCSKDSLGKVSSQRSEIAVGINRRKK